jgi:hypothetical protein
MLFLFTSFMRLSVAVFLDFGPPFPLLSCLFHLHLVPIYMPCILGSGVVPFTLHHLLETVTLDMEIDAIIIHVQYLDIMNFV